MKYLKKILIAFGVVMMLVFAILFCKIQILKKDTMSELAHSKIKIAVYLLEDNEYVPFFVERTDDSGNALLRRGFVAPELSIPISDYPSYCENCALDNYLNKEYIKKLEQAKDYIVSLNQVKDCINTDIVCKNSSGRCGNDIKQINRKIFFVNEGGKVLPAFYVKGDTKVKKVNLKGIGEEYVISE